MLMATGFWSEFWPALLATFGGVVLGVPTALFLETKRTARSRHDHEIRRLETLAQAAEVLRSCVHDNYDHAERLLWALDKKVIMPDIELEVARWDAVRDDFMGTSRDPELQSRLGYFFFQVQRNAERFSKLFDFTLGPAATSAKAPDVARHLNELLEMSLPELIESGHDLHQRLDAVITKSS